MGDLRRDPTLSQIDRCSHNLASLPHSWQLSSSSHRTIARPLEHHRISLTCRSPNWPAFHRSALDSRVGEANLFLSSSRERRPLYHTHWTGSSRWFDRVWWRWVRTDRELCPAFHSRRNLGRSTSKMSNHWYVAKRETFHHCTRIGRVIPISHGEDLFCPSNVLKLHWREEMKIVLSRWPITNCRNGSTMLEWKDCAEISMINFDESACHVDDALA